MMKKRTIKFEYAFMVLLICMGIFNSCTGVFINRQPPPHTPAQTYVVPKIETTTGNYLAGRVAHLRQDLNKAANYYTKAIELGLDNQELIARTYLLLTIEGRIDEAHKYAKIARDNGDKNSIIKYIDMTYHVKKSEYSKAMENFHNMPKEFQQTIIFPTFHAWEAAAKGNKEQAIEALSPLLKNHNIHYLYYMHAGMIYDYFGDSVNAQESFSILLEDENLELSYRSLQIIVNFYVRNNKKQQALDLIEKYIKNGVPIAKLERFSQQIKDSDKSPRMLIDTPQKGIAEALFNTGTIFRPYQVEIALMFMDLALYLNPEHDIAHLSIASLLENNQRFEQAQNEYAKVQKESPFYFLAKYKIASLYFYEQNYLQALKQFEKLNKEIPNDYQVLFKMGEVCHAMEEYSDAIDYYNQAISVLPKDTMLDWRDLFALGRAYYENQQFEKADDILNKALKISDRHPSILNYLGYIWLEHNKNPNEALYMLFEAYQQLPNNGYIMDSLGWALFQMGKYSDALELLEQASETIPDNAIICNHLGDAYWQVGRKKEAKYQWARTLGLKEAAKDVNFEEVHKKLNNGIKKPNIILFNEPLLLERLKTLQNNFKQ